MSVEIANYFNSLRESEATASWIATPANDQTGVRTDGAPNLIQADGTRTPRIAIVAGTRPEVIKLAPVYHALKAGPVDVSFIATRQHREMADQALATFGITPDHSLTGLEQARSLSQIQARILTSLSEVFEQERPDLIIVQGDTSSAFAGALVGFNMEIPVAHVEAGLTSQRKYDPYPEEMLRTLIREVASYFFAPTKQAFDHLRTVGVEEAGLYLTGNTVVDAARYVAATRDTKPACIADLDDETRIVLVTTHRREAWGKGINDICEAVSRLANAHPDVTFVWPVHLNPTVKDAVESRLSGRANIRLTPPLGYEDFIGVLSRSTLALTDSGGVQEEAPSFGVPVLVMRDVTERPEAVEAGLARIVGKETAAIFGQAHILLENEMVRSTMAKAKNPFGDGLSGPRIARILEKEFGLDRAEIA